MFIYLTENLINGKKYIGMCTREDDSYYGSGTLLKQAIKKYGKENFKRTILEECFDIESLSIAEEKWIKNYEAVENENFYNLSHGGYGGNPETVKKYWNSLTVDERKERNKHRKNWDVKGENNPMHGKSAIKENNLKWYNDGHNSKMFVEGSQPEGYFKGRKIYTYYDKTGKNNPRSKKAIVNGKEYDCLKDSLKDYPEVPYSTMKYIARMGNKNNKYGLEISYA